MLALSDILKDGVSAFTVGAGGSGSAVGGNAVVNFGAHPGSGQATVVITGQTGITANSVIMAAIRPVATADHSADEHLRESLKIVAGDVVAGVGFTIYAFKESRLNEQDTRAYGLWNVTWIYL